MIARTLVLGLAILGGAATSQLPEFAQQYRQRLGGTIDALARVMWDFREDAARSGLSVPEAIQRLTTAPDPLVAARGRRMHETLDRLVALSAQQEAFRQAGSLVRLVVLARGLDPQLARAAFRDYEPAVPVTFEGAVSAGAGFLTVLAGASALTRVRRSRHQRRARAGGRH